MDKVWKAKWIMDEAYYGLTPVNVFHKQLEKPQQPKHMENLKNRHTLVRKKFTCSSSIRKAHIDITADDYYKLYVNGHFVGQGPAPSYHYHYNYNRYDVAGFLNEGENIIAVHVYYQGLINRVWNSGDYRQGIIAELFVNDDLCLVTDTSWKYTSAREYSGESKIGYETQFLENIDENLKESGWRNLEYDDTSWHNACVNNTYDYKLILQPTPPLEVYMQKPQDIREIEEGHFIIDFGHEITGQFKMAAKGEKGQQITIMHGEELESGPEYKVRYKMRCNCTYLETWTLSGRDDTLEYFDYKAFRYVEIVAPAGILNPETFCAVVRHYPFDESKCLFDTSYALLNNIWSICKNGVKYGSQEVYVDCPSREKGQYLGDATITTSSHVYLTGDLRLFRKCLEDFASSTYICPGIMAVAPGSLMQEIADFSLQWPLQLLNYYYQSGDLEFLKRMYPVAEGVIKHFKKYQREDGLLENVKDKWNLVDWPQNLRDGYDFDLSTIVGDGCHNVINAFYLGAVKTLNKIKDILGISYTDTLPQLKDAFKKAFFRNEYGLFADSTVSMHTTLHSNIIPLFYNLVPDSAIQNVVGLIRTKGFNCGVYTSYFLLKGLANAGEYNLIFNLIASEDEHSWGNMIKEGATTCFEAWGKDQKWNTSLCHPWASAPIPVLIEDIIGLKPAKPGWEEISFTPRIPDRLKHLHFKIHVNTGVIKVEFKNGKASISVPESVAVHRS